MGDFAFARSFDMLRDQKWHHAVLMLRRAMSLLGPLSPVPWLAQIGFSVIPNNWVVKDWYSMMGWCKQRMADRIDVNYSVHYNYVQADELTHADGSRKNRRVNLSDRSFQPKWFS